MFFSLYFLFLFFFLTRTHKLHTRHCIDKEWINGAEFFLKGAGMGLAFGLRVESPAVCEIGRPWHHCVGFDR